MQFDLSPTNFFRPSEIYCRELLEVLDDHLRILDVGCGDGTDAITLASASNEVWGIDISPVRLKRAREKVKQGNLDGRIHFDQMDANQLGFPDNYFHLIIGNSVLLFLDRDKFLRECLRVLKPGGRALFSNESLRNHPLLRLRRRFPGVHGREQLADRLDLEKIEAMGTIFPSVKHREFYLTSVLLAPVIKHAGHHQAAKLLVNSLNNLDDFLLRMFPSLRNYCWLSVIKLQKEDLGKG